MTAKSVMTSSGYDHRKCLTAYHGSQRLNPDDYCTSTASLLHRQAKMFYSYTRNIKINWAECHEMHFSELIHAPQRINFLQSPSLNQIISFLLKIRDN